MHYTRSFAAHVECVFLTSQAQLLLLIAVMALVAQMIVSPFEYRRMNHLEVWGSCVGPPGLAADVVAGHVVAGHLVAAHVVAGHVVAGHVVAGHLVAADVVAGHVVAGHLVAAHVVAGHHPPHPHQSTPACHPTHLHPRSCGVSASYAPPFTSCAYYAHKASTTSAARWVPSEISPGLTIGV
eukprot:365685-Chlamydomonas_euryale.AAC.7